MDAVGRLYVIVWTLSADCMELYDAIACGSIDLRTVENRDHALQSRRCAPLRSVTGASNAQSFKATRATPAYSFRAFLSFYNHSGMTAFETTWAAVEAQAAARRFGLAHLGGTGVPVAHLGVPVCQSHVVVEG